MSNHQELQSLAAFLTNEQEAILNEWENAAKKDVTSATELKSLSRKRFRDNVPVFLKQLCKALKEEGHPSKDVGKKHGENRWEHGFKLQETIREWESLHRVLMEHINRYEESNSLELKSFKHAQDLLARHIHQAIIFSVKEYNQLQKAEAEAQMRDLQQALGANNTDTISHTEDLRQTSHDIKGMVHILRTGFFLLKNKKFDEETRETMDQMSAAADDLNHLLSDLLDLFRLEAGKEKVSSSKFDVAKLLRDLCEKNQPIARKEQLDLRCKGDEKLLVRTDLKKVKRIVQNLVSNSLEYTNSGYVEVEWKLEKKEYWMVRISDTGPGLGATHASSLTTDTKSSSEETSPRNDKSSDAGHGEGIGLLIVRRLCELLEAVINVKTKKDEGTTYKIIFPVDAE